MGTHAVIAIQYNENIHAVYCHWDGYLAGVGSILKEHYTNEEKIDKLMECGDMSSLGEDIKSSVFYHRDLGEEFDDVRIFTDSPFSSARQQLLEYANRIYISYIYLFVEGVWIMKDTKDFKG